MLEYNFEGKNIFNPIDNRMQEIIETFVEFYGEENRNHISSQLNNAKIFFLGQVGYYGRNSLAKTIEYCFFNKQIEKIKKLLNTNIDVDPIQFRHLLFKFNVNGNNKKYDVMILMQGLGMFEKVQDEDQKNEIYEILKQDVQSYHKFLEKVYKLKKYYQQIEDKKDQVINHLPENLKSLSTLDDLKNQYNTKIKQLLIDYGKKNNLKLNLDIELFDLENIINVILTKNPFAYINLNYVKYILDFLGIEYDHNETEYEKILQNEKLTNILNDEDFYKNFMDIKIERRISTIKNNIFFKDFIDNLTDTSNLFNFNKIVDSAINFIFLNSSAGYVQMVSEGEKAYNICVLPQAFDLNDALLFHELTHIVESDFNRDEKGMLNYKVGFLEVDLKETKEKYNLKKIVKNIIQNQDNEEDNIEKKEIDNFEVDTFFNEVVTDYFACKIYDIFKEKYKPIGLIDEQFFSSYSIAFPIIHRFLDDNLEDIKECRISNDANAFKKLIGEDCYRKLAINLNNFIEFINKNNLSDLQILENIAKKANLNTNDLYDCFKYDCNWTEDEKTIINICKEIDEVGKIVKLRKKFDQDTKNKRNSNKDSLNHIER